MADSKASYTPTTEDRDTPLRRSKGLPSDGHDLFLFFFSLTLFSHSFLPSFLLPNKYLQFFWSQFLAM